MSELPDATTVNEALPPSATLTELGCVVMLGAELELEDDDVVALLEEPPPPPPQAVSIKDKAAKKVSAQDVRIAIATSY